MVIPPKRVYEWISNSPSPLSISGIKQATNGFRALTLSSSLSPAVGTSSSAASNSTTAAVTAVPGPGVTSNANNNNHSSSVSSSCSINNNNNNSHPPVLLSSSSSGGHRHHLHHPQQQHSKLSDFSNNNNNNNHHHGSSNCISNSNNTSSCSTASSTKDVHSHSHHRHSHSHHHHQSSGSGGANGSSSGREHLGKGYSYHTLTSQPSSRKKAPSAITSTLPSTAKGSPFCTMPSGSSCCSAENKALMHLSMDEANLTTGSDSGGIRKNRTPTLKAIGMSQSMHVGNSSGSSSGLTKAMVSSNSNGRSNGTSGSHAAAAEEVNGGAPSTKPSYSPMQVLMMFGNKLSPYEYREILDYKRIYFIGNAAATAGGGGGGATGAEGTTNGNGSNNNSEPVAAAAVADKTEKSREKEGTDTSTTTTTTTTAGGDAAGAEKRKGQSQAVENFTPASHDHVAYRYEVLKLIGKGSFGVVYKAYDHKYGRYVALKMVRNERRFHRQAQEEIRILEYLRHIDSRNEFNVIHIFDHFMFRMQMFITFELLYINLFELIRKNKFCGFSIQVVRKFAHSLLICLNALHTQKIIHCDLKPENILLKQQGRSGIKVSGRK